MKHRASIIVVVVCAAVAWTSVAGAVSIELNAVTYPERKTIKLEFARTDRAPAAAFEAKVDFAEGQAEIEIDFRDMKPAVLFGGDITCYVVWAVSRDGTFSNLGELWMPENKGELNFRTGRKAFALMITAEPFSLVSRPSPLVLMSNAAVPAKKAPTDTFMFSGFADAPDHLQESIKHIAWDSTTPLDLMQAEKAYELAKRSDAEDYAGAMMRDAWVALGQARNLIDKTKTRVDYSRRSIALSSDAIQVTQRRKEAEELERQIAARRAEMAQLEEQAREADVRAKQADERARQADLKTAEANAALEEAQRAILAANEQRAEAEEAVQRTGAELERIASERTAIASEKQALELEQATLLKSLEGMREESARLLKEREELSNRLEGALSQVAETRDSARGLIVNLPDILFDLNKAALKPETKVIIAKMAGILLIMPELNVRVEGHTDATGGEDYNQKLSEQRAEAVSGFLRDQGIDVSRLQAVGYGETRPVADNESADGRKRNRRVEIIIAQGEIKGDGAAGDE